MAAAARLAARGRPLSNPNPAVAAIIVNNGIVVGRGWTQPGGRPHAEAVALEQAGEQARGATMYVTLEPCAHDSARGPACADLIANSGLASVVIGQSDPDPRTAGQGAARIADAGIEVSVLEDPASQESLCGYLALRQLGRPFITLKLAISRDGFIARPAGGEQWITGEEARAHVHARRAKQDAILVGGGTWRKDKPGLDVRLPGIEDRSPQRYVLTQDPLPDGTIALASPDAVFALEGVQFLYVEGGAGAAQAFLGADLVDRLELYRASIDVGDGLRAPAGLDRATLDASDVWRLAEQCQLGSDRFTAYSRAR
ncbi:MAG: bifunctional diaminohydroxyphosphoribosylaminopyrimidine deaminase/5-amino-6-(5-phosphoribosylamino)uracil reductase RibD [Alphaproteobacteria bacterium]|nr:MAG: bifunctional diaminohydroxyphosphoribosylaminopyrimidine deaminase/5-amino-6-(5-phosphoribosylamino)uracil reductase RibD [Alphaproteobacteria bacterium]